MTRYKMNALTFDSLRIALDDSGARVRIEDEIPPAIPFVKGYVCPVDSWTGNASTSART